MVAILDWLRLKSGPLDLSGPCLRDSQQTNGWSLHYFYDEGVGKIQFTQLLWLWGCCPRGPSDVVLHTGSIDFSHGLRCAPFTGPRNIWTGVTPKWKYRSHVIECFYCRTVSNKWWSIIHNTVSGRGMYDGSLAQYESIPMIFVHPLILPSLYLHGSRFLIFGIYMYQYTSCLFAYIS